MESSKRGYRVDTMLVISFTSRLHTAIVSSIIVFGHATVHAMHHAMHTCKSERAHPSSSIQSVDHFVAICIIPINNVYVIISIRYSEIFANYGCHYGVENRICFHKAEKFLTAEDGFVSMR